MSASLAVSGPALAPAPSFLFQILPVRAVHRQPQPQHVDADPPGHRFIPLAHVHVGDKLRVRPGGMMPVDGVVTEGRSALGESMLTGERLPMSKRVGDKLIGARLNISGALVMQSRVLASKSSAGACVQRTDAARALHRLPSAQRCIRWTSRAAKRASWQPATAAFANAQMPPELRLSIGPAMLVSPSRRLAVGRQRLVGA